MAAIISSNESAGFLSLLVDSDPDAGPGLAAPVGATAMVESTGARWVKDGTADTGWSLLTTGSQSLSAYTTSNTLIPGSTLTAVLFGGISWMDTAIFGLSIGGSDIEVKKDSMISASGQFSVVFTTGGSNSSRTKARGYLYKDETGGGAGPWVPVPGTRGWGYHRVLDEGDDTIALSREFHVTAGTYLRYAVQRVSGTGALMIDGDGCNLILRRTGQ